jgi:predicted aspartyl protease
MTSVPVAMAEGRAVVTAALNGQNVRLLLDTGGSRSLLTLAEVQRLGLPPDEWVGTTLRGAGNELETRQDAIAHSIALGGLALRPRGTAPRLSLPVTAQPLDQTGDVGGLLGADLLSLYDLDLDFPTGRLTLYRVTGCSGRFIPWSEPFDSVAGRQLPFNRLLIPVQIDGHDLDAQLDTGATVSVINARGLHRLALTPEALAGDPVAEGSAVGGKIEARLHRFRELRVGAALLENPIIHVVALPRPAVDMLLGMDFLAPRHVWISYATSQLFIVPSPR